MSLSFTNPSQSASVPSVSAKAKHRYALLDEIRGFALVNMVVYHAVWDLVYLFGWDWDWYQSGIAAFLWQQMICWTFILLSGFCQPFGKHKLKRALFILCSGFLVSFVTAFAQPQAQVRFGILTMLGSCMLIMIVLEQLFHRCRPIFGLAVGFFLFLLTQHIDLGYLGFGNRILVSLPLSWYRNDFTAYLGFPNPSFSSADYFPLLPWFFLFLSGYFLHRLFLQKDRMKYLQTGRIKPLIWCGRHSLPIYLLHQPVLFVLLTAFFSL